MKKVLFAITSHNRKGGLKKETGCYITEVAVPYKYLRRKGVEIDFVSPNGGRPPIDPCNISDDINKPFLEDVEAQEKFNASLRPEQVKVEDYVAIYYPGGHGVMWDIPDCDALARIASGIYENGGLVVSICHGGAGLLNVRLSDGSYLIEGKKLTAFSNEEELAIGGEEFVPFLLESELRRRGAVYSCASMWQSKVIRDGLLITGQNPASDQALALEFFKALKALDIK